MYSVSYQVSQSLYRGFFMQACKGYRWLPHISGSCKVTHACIRAHMLLRLRLCPS